MKAWEKLRASREALDKSRDIFRDFARDLYFPALRLSPWQRTRCTPVLFLVEFLVYRVDAVAEHTRDVELETDGNQDYQKLVRYKQRFATLLRRLGAYDEAVGHQLDQGERYVRLENRVTTYGAADHADVMRLVELRSSDLRLLHTMIYPLLGRPVDQHLLDVLWPVEVLADIGNDLAHYEHDVRTGNFNAYDALVRLYGPDAPQRLRDETARYERMFHERLDGFPDGQRTHLAALCLRRYRTQIDRIPQPVRSGSDEPSTTKGSA
ncbi:hypothetical protein MRQ36_28150 [Micromonospora sp. R77]|uniref:hypothetical protein n=1 Tax=Micromonospora sp. R77 TaxID=2925836 RepID=UPI001F61E6E9|nr:hypothetical protein [Micromonospora sp. R77]MCI4066213.1 hypothetical protein [Micromonospora sp. R77]